MYKEINLRTFGDNRGEMVVIENSKDIPFEVKRVYYIFNTKSQVSRGFHAHKDIKQLLVCVSGSWEINLDNGNEKVVVELSSPKKGIIIGSLVWREMKNFSSDCVLLVITNSFYSEQDYIRDYEEFLKIVNQK